MSLITSFPELISSIYGAISNNPMFAIYNETGSNTIQIFMLSFVLLIFFGIGWLKNKKAKEKNKTINDIYQECIGKSGKENNILVILLIIFYFIFLLFVLVPGIGKYLYIPGWNISIISIIPFVFRIGFMVWTLVKKSSIIETPVYQGFFYKLNIWYLWIIFIVLSGLLVLISYVNSGVVDKMGEFYNVPTQSAAGIILSITSALPETTTMIFLFKNKQYTLGYSELVGSGLTNSSFMFYVDSIYRQPIFKEYFDSYLNSTNENIRISSIRMQYWIPLILGIYLVLFLTTRKKVVAKNSYVTIGLSIISLAYILGFSLISSLVF